MLKKQLHVFRTLICCFVFASITSLPLATQARDLEDADKGELQRFCESVWKLAKVSAKKADSGVDEDTALQDYEIAAQGELGPSAMHVMRTTIKGAYLRSSDETPSHYAGRVQADCMSSIK